MGDNADQKSAENVPPSQRSGVGTPIDPHLRQRVVLKLMETLRSRCNQPRLLSGVEPIARSFEERAFASATDERDYVLKILAKVRSFDQSPESAAYSPLAFFATGAPRQLHSASAGNVQSENRKHDERQVHSQRSSQLQPHQINHNSTSTNSSRIPTNFDRKVPEHSQQIQHRNRVKPSSVDQVPQGQPSNQNSSRGKEIISQPRLLQNQSIHKLLPNSDPTIQTEQPEVSSAYRHQSSWQRDVANQRKSLPPQQKPMPGKHEASIEKLGTFNNQQNVSRQPSRGHNVASQQTVQPHGVRLLQYNAQQISQQKVDVVREENSHTSGVASMSENIPRPGTGTIQSRSLPSEASKTVERHKDTEEWREVIQQRVLAMKKKYLTGIIEANVILDERLKLLNMQPDIPNRDIILKKLKECKMLVSRIYKFLNLSKDDFMPIHSEKLDQWEQIIVDCTRKFSRPNAPQSLPSLPPLARTPQARVTEEVMNVVSHQDQTMQPSQSVQQKLTSGPTSNLSPPNLIEGTDAGENLGTTSETIISDQRKVTQSPIERLLKAVSSVSRQALKSGIDDIFSVTCIGDVMESRKPSFTTITGALVLPTCQDLAATTGCRLQARNASLHNGGNTTRTWTPSPRLMFDDRETSNTESTAENTIKRPRVDHLTLLSEEIRKVNQRLIDIAVEISKEDASNFSGTVVKCCYFGISVNLGFMKSIIPSGNPTLIQPLRFLVPAEYPDRSPVLLDKLPNESGDICEVLSEKAREMLKLYLRRLDAPFSVSEVARKWELCARDALIEYAENFGGGAFSSKYGTWEDCLNIA